MTQMAKSALQKQFENMQRVRAKRVKSHMDWIGIGDSEEEYMLGAEAMFREKGFEEGEVQSLVGMALLYKFEKGAVLYEQGCVPPACQTCVSHGRGEVLPLLRHAAG